MQRWILMAGVALVAGACGDSGPLADLLETAPVAFILSVSDDGCVDENGELTYEGCGADGRLLLCAGGDSEWLRPGSDIIESPNWTREDETLVLRADGSRYTYTYDAPNLTSPEGEVWSPNTVTAGDCE
ncbi:MAG: hypothetical protein AB8H79_00050 [Myxococcota bacterium]